MTKRTTEKNVNLNTMKTGCTPCLNEVKKIEKKINNRNVSEIKISEIKRIAASLFSNE